jgi:hypothetical protein
MNRNRFHPLVDWTTLLPMLQRRVPLMRIGDTVGMDEKTINRLARGEIKEPRFGQGLRLLDLAVDYLTPEEWSRVRQASGRSFIHGG